MLVLSRKFGEKIIIGDKLVVITVMSTKPNGEIRLGIEAPKDVSVDREEVWKDKQVKFLEYPESVDESY